MAGARPVLIATSNPAKAARLRWLLAGLPFEPLDLGERPRIRLPEESGGSFLENASLKALAASAGFGGLAIASDGGVQIPALGAAWDALCTARAAGPGADDQTKARHLLALMAGKTGQDRRVQWHEAVALADRGEPLAAWEASGTEGLLTETYDPSNARPGFWVYSLWWFPALGKRYVDLTPEELEAHDRTWSALRAQVRAWAGSGAPGR